jgi:hypothetical protein
MAAAAWTSTATDITGKPDTWADYLSAEQLGDRIELAVETILDTLTRRITDETDPRIAIYRPAARIGPSRLNAMPRWTDEQASRYLALRAERDLAGRAERRRELPVYTKAAAARSGLAGTAELADILGCAENTIRWWARADAATFPAEVGTAAREGDFTFGPPRGLRRVRDVQKWVNADPARVERLERSRALREQAARVG